MTSRPIDRGIASLAGRQWGVVARRQLIELGVTPGEIQLRLRCGRLHCIHRSVYAVGHAEISRNGKFMAATLIAPELSLSHRSGAILWTVAQPRGGVVHVSGSSRIRVGCAVVGHLAELPPDERTVRYGIPVTSVARTLLDLAATEGAEAFERALRQAHYRRLTDPLGVRALIERYPGARGTAVAARALADGGYSLRTRSELEDAFLDFVRARRLPRPEVNATVEVGGARYEVDFLYREARLIVETDGARAHADPDRRERDLERDGNLQAHGFWVHRLSERRIARDGDRVERQLRLALHRSAAA